jgi:site-specific recombinase
LQDKAGFFFAFLFPQPTFWLPKLSYKSMRNIFKSNKAVGSPVAEAKVLSLNGGGNSSLQSLVDLIKHIRPVQKKNFEEAETKFKAMLYQLQSDKGALFSLRKTLLSQFRHTHLINAVTESGIVSGRGFVQELTRKIKHKLLPALQQPDDFLYVLDRIFYQKTDHWWVNGINEQLWIDFFNLVGIQVNISDPAIIRQLQEAMEVLSYRLVNLALEKDINIRGADWRESLEPFYMQNQLMVRFCQLQENNEWQQARKLLPNIIECLHNCRQTILRIRHERQQFGTSLAQAFIITRMQQLLDRMMLIVDALDGDDRFDVIRFVRYFKTVIRNENRKNSLGEFLSQNTSVLAYQIAEHGGRRGARFITSTRSEFARNVRSAMIGGVIVSFVAILKHLIGRAITAPFWQGLVYSANYSIGFVAIEESGGTLATKQPAYTANNIAGSFDVKKYQEAKPDVRNLAITVARTSRTQIASFMGNLIVVFPLTYLLAWLFTLATGSHITTGVATQKLLTDQQPGIAWVYACFTGFFLFLSGLIGGYVENHVVYGRIPERLKTHPILKNTLSAKRLSKLVDWVDANLGAFVGSIALGFFLGMAGFIGKAFSIPFDIRHITISAGNSAIAFFDSDHAVQLKEVLLTLIGIAGIGFLNFVVSFGFAFYVAVKSRGIHLRDYPEFLSVLRKYFVQYPSDFIRPHKNLRKPEDIRL